MAVCENCNEKFKFMDVLKSLTPWSISCSSCKEKIKSNSTITILAIVVFVVFCLFLFDVLVGLGIGFNGALGILLAIAFGMEVVWYVLLSKGIVKSNLVVNQ